VPFNPAIDTWEFLYKDTPGSNSSLSTERVSSKQINTSDSHPISKPSWNPAETKGHGGSGGSTLPVATPLARDTLQRPDTGLQQRFPTPNRAATDFSAGWPLDQGITQSVAGPFTVSSADVQSFPPFGPAETEDPVRPCKQTNQTYAFTFFRI
jgi:hypothetical protein